MNTYFSSSLGRWISVMGMANDHLINAFAKGIREGYNVENLRAELVRRLSVPPSTTVTPSGMTITVSDRTVTITGV